MYLPACRYLTSTIYVGSNHLDQGISPYQFSRIWSAGSLRMIYMVVECCTDVLLESVREGFFDSYKLHTRNCIVTKVAPMVPVLLVDHCPYYNHDTRQTLTRQHSSDIQQARVFFQCALFGFAYQPHPFQECGGGAFTKVLCICCALCMCVVYIVN